MFASPGVSPSHHGHDQQQQRVYVTSLANITSSSPSKKNWSRRNNDDESNHPVRTLLGRLLLRKRQDDVDIVDDSIAIGDSKRLQLSIIAEQQSAEDREIVYCCSSDEGDSVIRKMRKTAAFHLSEGHLKEALHTLNKCLALQQKLHGKESVEVADTFNMMGTIMANMGTEYHYRAMTAFEQALEKQIPPNPPPQHQRNAKLRPKKLARVAKQKKQKHRRAKRQNHLTPQPVHSSNVSQAYHL
jgi:hypothetical protein